jgi:hypothetical protein
VGGYVLAARRCAWHQAAVAVAGTEGLGWAADTQARAFAGLPAQSQPGSRPSASRNRPVTDHRHRVIAGSHGCLLVVLGAAASLRGRRLRLRQRSVKSGKAQIRATDIQ